MRIKGFSEKQLQVMTWWCPSSPNRKMDAIICDGAVRSGKTLCMGISFVLWAMAEFEGMAFGMCGKSTAALRRNVISTLLPKLRELGFGVRDRVSENLITVRSGRRENRFYLFGGYNESSADLIQGVTFAGVLMDEAALMPRSFVEQACARCSVQGSRLWFNCNPQGPEHWFYREWIKKARERRALYIHFEMSDNPSMSRKIIERYKRLYSGTFYRRFVLGQWVAADGLIYDFFDGSYVKKPPPEPMERYWVSCDYGTLNPASFGLWGLKNNVWYRLREFYFASKQEGRQKTDEEYADDLAALIGDRKAEGVVVDPSAASFIETLRRRGFRVIKADNDVLYGIRVTAGLLKSGRIVICSGCRDAIREFSLYSWQDGGSRDAPKKENDHAMDEIRYFAATVAQRKGSDGFAACAAAPRRG